MPFYLEDELKRCIRQIHRKLMYLVQEAMVGPIIPPTNAPTQNLEYLF